jgi:hypothetical protein
MTRGHDSPGPTACPPSPAQVGSSHKAWPTARRGRDHRERQIAEVLVRFGLLSPDYLPPNGPERSPPYAAAAFSTRSTPP